MLTPNGDSQWVLFWGGADPADCAGWSEHDEVDCAEMRQFFTAAGIATRTVTYGPWHVVADAADDATIDEAVVGGGAGDPATEDPATTTPQPPTTGWAIALTSAVYHGGCELRQARLARGWTQQELADRLGWSRSALANVETSRMWPSLQLLTAWTEALGYVIALMPAGEVPRG